MCSGIIVHLEKMSNRKENMDSQELAELLLTYLYDSSENLGHSYFFFRLNEFAAQLGQDDPGILTEAALVLEKEGLALVTVDGAGTVNGLITDQGCIYVEDGGCTGIIQRYRENPGTFVVVHKGEQVHAISREKVSLGYEINDILTGIVHVLESGRTLEEPFIHAIKNDIDIMNMHLASRSRDRQVIDSVIEKLGNIPAVSEKTMELKKLIEAYLLL